jgi:hypothetical protein
VRRDQGGEGKGLWCLYQTKQSAIDGCFHGTGIVDTLDCVGHRQPGNCCAGFFRRHNRARNQICAGEWARRIVNEHDVRLVRKQRLETGAYGGLAGRTAKDRGQYVQAGRLDAHEVGILGPDHRLHEAHRGGLSEAR